MKPIAPILKFIAAHPEERSTDALLQIIRALRPRKLEPPDAVAQRIRALIALLHTRPNLAKGLHRYVGGVFSRRLQRTLFADLGILANESVAGAILRRLIAKLLPPAYDETYLRDLFAALLHEAGDHAWLQDVPEALIVELMEAIGFGHSADTHSRHSVNEMLEALRILSLRLAAIGVEPDFLRYDPDAASRESPFVTQAEEIQAFIGEAQSAMTSKTSTWPDGRHLDVLLDQCEDHLRRIRQRAQHGGASITLTYENFRAMQIVSRMRQLIELTAQRNTAEQIRETVRFFREMMAHEAKKNSIRALLRQVTDLMALEVTEHASRTGEHYVTNSRRGYYTMFRAASGAGVIVAFMALFKLFIAKAKLPPLWEALGFSLNYGLGFVVVHLFHFTIATKQPAMTAAVIAASLEEGNGRKPPLEKLAKLVVDVLRTQFVAILGNVLLAFITCLGIGALWTWLFGAPQVDVVKAQHLLHDIDPIHSLAVPHAAIAGVCLYLSGLISGYYDNKCVYGRIPQRVRQLGWVRGLFGEKGSERIAHYLENNLGALAGNFLFGCMLGSMGTLGFILGLPLDIRHVTFAAANFAYALVALKFNVPWQILASGAAGVLLIGATNLVVSFSLALQTALKSRQVRFSHSKRLFGMVVRRFVQRPLEFIFPPPQSKPDSEPVQNLSREAVSGAKSSAGTGVYK
ncbi:MAG: site-specific recombinase [Betaproteobacteria bacterium]|nr:site-specific recombinase [Betaproteobacteria bacterium]